MLAAFCSNFKHSCGRPGEQVRTVMRLHHYNIRTEKSYLYWIRNFISFHQQQ
ncbi:phage integrase N-terminal SAM-like domain-containing protein [Aeromonas caviae]|uniref:phage integrase N-terminal SAM-like domain-containing protein n=1 Tax=Aeromonas caviae TaxID=648 RepID=UPI001CC75239